MNRVLAEWIWRAAVVGALAWIGWELHQIRQDMMQPADESTTAAAAPDADLLDSIDDLRDDVAALDQKVDALMIATLRLQR